MSTKRLALASLKWYSLQIPPVELRLESTLFCGQAFRWVAVSDHVYAGVVQNKLICLRQQEHDILYASPLSNAEDEPQTKDLLMDYFQLHIPLQPLYTTWSTDDNFKVKSKSFPGLRVMRQDPLENVFAFICSSNNNIDRITSMVTKLCETYGEPIGVLEVSETHSIPFHSFPKVEDLACEGVETKLRELGFGYRAKYIHQSAVKIAENGIDWLHSLRKLPYEEAKKELLTLSGVGPKVADCICLMSLDKPVAIPVDTHVWQIATRDYGLQHMKTKSLTETTYKAIGDKFQSIFGSHCGWAHTILFAADLKKNQKDTSSKETKLKKKRKRTD